MNSTKLKAYLKEVEDLMVLASDKLLDAEKLYNTKHRIEDELKEQAGSMSERAQLLLRRDISLWRNLPKKDFFLDEPQAMNILSPFYELLLNLLVEVDKESETELVNIDELVIQPKQYVKARQVLRGIFNEANNSICIVDKYLKPAIVDVLYEYLDEKPNLAIKFLITNNRTLPSLVDAVKTVSKEFTGSSIILKKHTEENHSRYIIVDNEQIYNPDHSLADWGGGGVTINKIVKDDSKKEVLASFDSLWSRSEILVPETGRN